MNVSVKMNVRAHFGLNATPFTREVAIKNQWRHPQYQEARDALLNSVQSRQSCALVAPSGCGKTQVLRGVRATLPGARYRVHYVHVTGLSKRDFCREVASALGLRPAGHLGALVRVIQEHSRSLLDEESMYPVLIVDEAHDLRNEVLATLRVLTNFEMDSRLVVSVVLAGQPQLREKLRHMDLECIRSRLAHIATLRLLTREESSEYIKHRLRECGGSDDLFDADAYESMYGCAQGNLRALDRIAAKSLEVATREGASVVGSDQVMTARGLVLP